MPRNPKTAAASGKAALPQLSKQMLEELIPGPVTKDTQPVSGLSTINQEHTGQQSVKSRLS